MKKILYVLLATCLFTASPVYGGMFDRGPDKKTSRESKSNAFKRAEEYFLRGEYEKVVEIGSKYGSSSYKLNDELQCITGRALLKLARYREARNRFSRVVNNSDSPDFLDEAYIGLADSYYLEGDYKKAKSDYESVTRYFPDSENMHIVYYKLGECYSKLGDNKASKKYYDKLIKAYPDSLEAKLLVGEKSDFVTYSVQAGSFSKWSNAKKLYDELQKKGFDANIHTAAVGKSRFYRVRVGQYGSLRDAENMALKLRNKGYPVKIYP